jgi:hypothetical protein
MRWHLTLVVIMSAACAPLRGMAAPDETAAWRDRGLIARLHFAGTEGILADPGATNLNAIAGLPETALLREVTFRKLAVAPYNFLRGRAAITNDELALFRPLMDDLFRAESYLELLDSTNEFPEMVFALRLDEDRARLWRTNLAAALVNWTGIPVTGIKVEGFDGWELRKHKDPNLFRFFRAGNWIVIGWGEDKLLLQPAILKRIRQTTRPVDPDTTNWLDAWVDWPELAPHHLAPESIELPAMRLLVQGRKDFVRSQLKMKFAAPLGLTLNPWRIPTNVIHAPLVSFTATRGLAPRLNETAAAKEFNLPPLPDQVYVWSLAGIPTQTHLVAPVTDASNYFAQLRPGLMAMANSFLTRHAPAKGGMGPASLLSLAAVYANDEIEITGVPPFVFPNLGALHDSNGDYVVGGLWPMAKSFQPMPPELLGEVMAHSNLASYGWEFTGLRLKQWHGFFQLGQMIFNPLGSDNETPASKWIEAVSPKLGRTATEVSLSAPDELTVVRNSAIGFTGLELSGLAYWLDSPGFPFNAAHPAGQWRPARQRLPQPP